MTLTEMLIVTVLFFLALTLITSLMMFGMRIGRLNESASEPTRQSFLIHQVIKRTLANASQTFTQAHYPSGDPNVGDLALAVCSSEENGVHHQEDGTGLPEYRQRIFLFRSPSDNTLRELKTAITPASSPPLLSLPDLDNEITVGISKQLTADCLLLQLQDFDSQNPTETLKRNFYIYFELASRSGPAIRGYRFPIRFSL